MSSASAVVVGGGIIGLMVARSLRQAGMSVTLLDRDQTGRQASWASAGIVTQRAPWATSANARLSTLSADLWPILAAELRDEAGMDVEYRETGVIYPAFDAEDATRMRDETRAIQAAGIPFEFVEGAALREAEPALGPTALAAQIGGGGNVENRRAVRALDIANRRSGVRVETGVQVLEIVSRRGRVSGVRAIEGSYSADVVVLAAGSWSGQVAGVDPIVPVVPQRGQILALGAGEVTLRRTVMKPNDPYFVPRADGRTVVGATREFVGYNRSLTAGGVAWLLSEAVATIPALAGAEIVEMWTGFRPVSADGAPIIGASAIEGLYYATGHGPTGVGPAPGTAALLAALILGKEPPVPAGPFSPMRFAAAPR